MLTAVSVIVQNPEVEILQSAEILQRELRARGVQVADNAPISLTLSAELLQSGQVELLFPQKDRRLLVSLEDCVDEAAAWSAESNGLGR